MGHLHEQDQHLSARATSVTCRPDRTAYSAKLDGNTLLLQAVGGAENSRWQLQRQADQLVLEWMGVDIEKPKLVEVLDRKSTRLNSSHLVISYAVFCLKKKK